MKRYLPFLLCVLFFLPACGTLATLSQTIKDAREIAGHVRQTVDKVQPEIDRIADMSKDIAKLGSGLGEDLQQLRQEFKALDAESRKAADKDGDGELSWTEMLIWLLTMGGGSVVIGRKYLARMQERLVADTEARVVAKTNPPTTG